jgi:hypothetical protein
MGAHRVLANLRVDQFGLTLDDNGRRLDFPRAEADHVEGHADGVRYGARELVFDRLSTRLDRTQWEAEAMSAGPLWLGTDDGRVELTVQRAELARGIMITRAAAGGVELLAPHASLSEVRLKLPRMTDFGHEASAVVEALPAVRGDALLRQHSLRFLDGLSGQIKCTIKVVLDLPVIGQRTLDQKLVIPIADGSLDFRALEDSLDWLEGTFLDLGITDDRLAISWGVPLLPSKEIVSFALDRDAQALGAFTRVPVRSFADFRVPPGKGDDKKKSRLKSLTVADLDVTLSLQAPRSLEVGGGAILFGGEDAPGLVDLAVTGSLTHPPGPGSLNGTIGLVDVTVKDVKAGPILVTVDRLHLGAIEGLELSFDGFRPAGLTCMISRATATNLTLGIGATHR